MKNVLVALLALCVFTTGVFARDIVLDKKTGSPTGITLISDNLKTKAEPGLNLDCHVGRMTASEVDTPKGKFTMLSIPGFQHSNVIGAPALPVMNRLIEVPFGAEPEATVVASDLKTFSAKDLGITSPLYPRQPPQPKDGTQVPFAYEKSAYQAKGFFQEELVSVEEIGVMRSMRLVLLKVAPVAYDAVEGKLEVRSQVKVKLALKKADLGKTARIKRTYGSSFFTSLTRDALIAPSMKALAGESKAKPVTYAIVADRMFENELKPFVDWKTAKGFKVIIGYTDQIGNTTDQIKTWVANLYNAPAEDAGPPDFLLIVGDKEQVPAFPGKSGSHITDLYYVCVTPGDNIPDILCGRFSAQTKEQLVPQIEKTLQYEKYEMPDPAFLANTLMIAGWDYSYAKEWGWPQINYGTKYYFNAENGMPGTVAYLSAGSGQNVAAIKAKMNEGCSLVNYTAHGSQTSWADPSFSPSDIEAMTNDGKYPLMIGNCCLTNSFQVSTCFGEALLRAKNKGAIGYIGGSNSTYWDEDLWWGVGFYPILHPNPEGAAPDRAQTGNGSYDGIFLGNYYTNGGLMLAGNLAVEQSTTSRKLYYWEVYHLMGDPSVMVYWGLPKDNAVEFPAQLSANTASVDVKAAPGSYVGISMNGALLGSAKVGDTGVASVGVKALAAGEALVVVTGKNLKPFQGKITVQ